MIQEKFYNYALITNLTFMHLADAFTQSDLGSEQVCYAMSMQVKIPMKYNLNNNSFIMIAIEFPTYKLQGWPLVFWMFSVIYLLYKCTSN